MLSKKQKIRHAVIFVSILVFCIVAVNYYVDSYAQLRISYREIAQQMADGKNVVGLTESRCNERYLAYAMIEDMEEPMECIVLGSSRSMIYGKEHFDVEDSFYNFSLSGGVLKDYYGIIGYLENEDLLPERIIMEIGGPLFYDEDTENRYVDLQDGIDYLDKVIAGEAAQCNTPEVGKQYHKLLAIDYFKYNLQSLLKNVRFDVEYTEEAMHETMSTRMSDGSITYSEQANDITVEYVDSMIEQAISTQTLYKVEGYTQMSETHVESFERLVEWLTDKGVEVSFFLPPYAEEIYTYMENSDGAYDGVLDTEEYIVKYAEENGIKLYGSFSPSGCNLTSEDLLDAYHMRREVAEKALYLR